MRILKTKNVPAVIMIIVIVLFGLSVGKPYAVTLEELRSGAVGEIIIGDIKFDSWDFGTNPQPPSIDPSKMYVTPINDPVNPGLLFDTTGQLDGANGGSGWKFSFRVSTLSGRAIIEGHSVELIDFKYAEPPLTSNVFLWDRLEGGAPYPLDWQTALGSEYLNPFWPNGHFYQDFDSATLGPHSVFRNGLIFQVTDKQLPSSINKFELKYLLNPPLIPNFHVRPVLQWVDGFDWPKDADVTLIIEDFTATETVTTCDHNPDMTCVRFELGDDFPVQTGHIVTLTDGNTTKTHTVTNLAVTSMDLDLDTVSGTADSDDEIEVEIFDVGCFVSTIADGSGNWIADFREICDIGSGTKGAAYEPDDDGDRTHIDWMVPIPNFHVRPELQWVDGFKWQLGAEVTLTIDDPSNGTGVDFTATETVTTCDHNPDMTCVRFELGDDFPVQTGHIVTLTDGNTTKTHTVTNLAVTSMDLDLDTVSGTADSDDEIEVEIFDSDCFKKVTADTSGNWTADFNGDCDIIADTRGGAYEPDEDGDRTHIDWPGEDTTPPEVSISATPETLWPPNHKMRDVLIQGEATDLCSDVTLEFTVVDEYGEVEPDISDFGEVIQLKASRLGKDKDGRTYTIFVTAEDGSGNTSSASTVVLVPHDQGKKKK